MPSCSHCQPLTIGAQLASIKRAAIAPLVGGIFLLGVSFGVSGRCLLSWSTPFFRRLRRFLNDSPTCGTIQAEADGIHSGPTYRALCKHLHGTVGGPFACCMNWLPEDHSYPHTNMPRKFLIALFNALNPAFLVEVGSFKGGSALRIADAAAEIAESRNAVVPCLLCVDTWLGDTAMWLNHNSGWRDWLMLDCGHPQLYLQFLANTRRRREIIMPLPLTSLCGLRAIQQLVLRGDIPPPEFIYLDSAHEKGESLLEMRQAFRVLADGGVLAGDDLDWPAVQSDLLLFLSEEPAVTGLDDPLLSAIRGLFHRPEGYWVLDTTPRQWVLRKRAGGLEELRVVVERETLGAEPADYEPLTAADRTALQLYEEAVRLAETGAIGAAATHFRKAAAASSSLASHFSI